MKRQLSLLLIIALLMLSLTACVPTSEEESKTPTSTTEPTQTETDATEDYFATYEQICVDIGVNGDGYYGMWADVDINYGPDGTPWGIYIADPTLLYFTVSSEFGGGVYLLDLDEGNTAIDELTDIAEALKAAGLTEYAERIDAIIQIIGNSGPFTQAST